MAKKKKRPLPSGSGRAPASTAPREFPGSVPEHSTKREPPVERPPAAVPRSGALVFRPAWVGFLLVLAICIAWPLVHAFLIDRVTVRLCEDADQGIPKEKRLPVFLSEIAFDGYVWNRHAEDLGKHGDLRVRWTDFDNAPIGREVHWNSAFSWYLRVLGEIYRAFTGESLRNSIYRMSIWANPILLVCALGVFSTLSARRFGPLCGSVLAIGMVAVPTFYEGFMPAYPDHHGLIAFCHLGLLFGIAWAGAGWLRCSGARGPDYVAASRAQARNGMLFSAACGAAGLWISALSTAIVLGAVGVAALVAAAVHGPARAGESKGEAELESDLWWFWAKRGAAIALGFYLLEYFPFHMGMRLEVNHPLYALAWLGGGAVLARLTGWLRRPKIEAFPFKSLLLPVAACLPLPACILIGGAAVYIPNDPFMGRLWKNIAELLPLLKRVELGALSWGVAIGWFPLLLVAALFLQFHGRVGKGSKATLLFLMVPILVTTGLQFYQVRWGMLTGPLYIALGAVAIPQIWKLLGRDLLARGFVGLIMVGFGLLFVQPAFRNSFKICWTQYHQRQGMAISPGQALALLHRQMARAILDDAGDRPVVLLSSPNSSCLLSAIGGFKTIGTLYWENVDGLKSAARALNAQSDEETLELFRKHGVTYVSMMSWENFIEPYFRILYPEAVLGKAFEKSFGKRALFDSRIPSFTRPLPFPKNNLTEALRQRVLMLAFDPEMKPHETAFHNARFQRIVEGREVDAEFALAEVLAAAPDFAPAKVELAKLMLSQRRFEEMASKLAEAFPEAPGIEALREAARLATMGNRTAAAEALSEAVAAGHPEIAGAAREFLHRITSANQPPSAAPSAP